MLVMNASNKAVKREIGQCYKFAKKVLNTNKAEDNILILEWAITNNTNLERGEIIGQSQLKELYPRTRWDANGNLIKGCFSGITKITHTCNHKGEEFKNIVIKRFLQNGCIVNKGSGNQLIEELDCWNKYALTEVADYLCPILKAYTSKSDKVTPTSPKALDNVIIIAQKACEIGNAMDACYAAEELNEKYGFIGESAMQRLTKMERIASKLGWDDVIHNGGNSGVIFDYIANCYKAVFVDYAL